jgi:hypothetical protein
MDLKDGYGTWQIHGPPRIFYVSRTRPQVRRRDASQAALGLPVNYVSVVAQVWVAARYALHLGGRVGSCQRSLFLCAVWI